MKVLCFVYFMLLFLFASASDNSVMRASKKIISFDDLDFEHVDLVQVEASSPNTLKQKIRKSPKFSRSKLEDGQ